MDGHRGTAEIKGEKGDGLQKVYCRPLLHPSWCKS